MKTQRSMIAAVILVLAVTFSAALAEPEKIAAPILTLDRIFNSSEFAPERFGPARWRTDGESYTTLEPSAEAKVGRDLILYKAETGKRTVLVSAARLIPRGSSDPLAIEDYSWSADGRILILFTNSKRVWRQNTRGDFWTYDLTAGRLRKLGSTFEPSTLMFAKLSPDGRLAAYVVDHNIFVENPAAGTIRQLTFDGDENTINGTSDWVNEEELDIRDGFRWSPDGRAIAFWQFDTRGVPEFSMINNTDGIYPTITRFKYPKSGQTNSAVRVGVVPVAGGYPVWMKASGDPRDI